MELSSEFLDKYNVSGPRYTSYPPANFFHTNISTEDYIKELKASNTQQPENISIYVHIPFCPVRCHFCGCNSIEKQNKATVRRYIDAIKVEIKNVTSHLDKSRKVTQVHWGGGTPNSISMEFIEEVMVLLKQTFTFAPYAEIAMECSRAYLDYPHIDKLAELGFNRVSLGIQDFREDILEVVNRQKPKHPVKDVVEYLRKKGFNGINLDFIYGLPMQTVESFHKTLEQAIAIKPDRIVTFSYAHVPWVKEAQKILEKVGLPNPKEKITMLINSIKQLEKAGYLPIGIDHFAKPEDDLAKAFVTKKLHRNFQGYCTLETTGQVYGFGASSISQLWGGYIQNIKGISEYVEAIETKGYAVERGYLLDRNEQIVRSVINSIMCNGFLSLDEVAKQFDISKDELKKIIAFDISKFASFEEDELIEIKDDTITLSDEGRMVGRNIAMALDPALKQGEAIYSKTL